MTSSTLPQWLRPLAESVPAVATEQLSPARPEPPDDARPAAVLVCFGDGEAGPELLLTERAPDLRTHAGQIAFPGGAGDPGDDDAVATALRESYEEVGLEPADVEVFGVLPEIWLPPSNFAVSPVLAYRPGSATLAPRSPAEVRSVIHQPISALIDPAKRFTVVHPLGWRGPGFDVDCSVPLWGFTALVVAALLDHTGWAEPWDESRTHELVDLT